MQTLRHSQKVLRSVIIFNLIVVMNNCSFRDRLSMSLLPDQDGSLDIATTVCSRVVGLVNINFSTSPCYSTLPSWMQWPFSSKHWSLWSLPSKHRTQGTFLGSLPLSHVYIIRRLNSNLNKGFFALSLILVLLCPKFHALSLIILLFWPLKSFRFLGSLS